MINFECDNYNILDYDEVIIMHIYSCDIMYIELGEKYREKTNE